MSPYKSDAQRKLVWAKKGQKPTRYRFIKTSKQHKKERLGFKGKNVVEVVEYKK
jgi:hypothetical protein